jgi:mRNA-degrading endonuclease RelE of RelBE toxin-antitoxin system
MVDNIQKALNKLSDEESGRLKKVLKDISNHIFAGLDIKKLKGRDDIYRVRKGKTRIIYKTDKSGEVFIICLDHRSDTTYNL